MEKVIKKNKCVSLVKTVTYKLVANDNGRTLMSGIGSKKSMLREFAGYAKAFGEVAKEQKHNKTNG